MAPIAPRTRRRLLTFAVVLLPALLWVSPAPAARDTVTISGKAYRFNHMDTFIPGATIRVREFPRLSAVTDEVGDYALRVPSDANVTPYIDPPEPYNEVDLQTFHPRGRDIDNANFQTPHDNEYNALAALLGVPIGADGRPEGCVVVTTVSARNVRGVDYETFEERTPHGVAGATAEGRPAIAGPVYFNENVIPDPSETDSSADGGIIWPDVPTGSFRFVAEHPSARFASLLATCAPGRVVNASPPWGAYELKREDRPLRAGVVAGSIEAAATSRAGRKRRVEFDVAAGEPLAVEASLRKRGRRVGHLGASLNRARQRTFRMKVNPNARGGRAELRVRIRDAAAASVLRRIKLKLPRPASLTRR